MLPTSANVDAFIDAVPNEHRRSDARELCELMRSVTGEPPVMWGPSIVGFGSYRYRYESGRTGDAPLAGFSPPQGQRRRVPGRRVRGPYPKLVDQLGPHKAGKACLYLKRLGDVDVEVLHQLVERALRVAQRVHEASRR